MNRFVIAALCFGITAMSAAPALADGDNDAKRWSGKTYLEVRAGFPFPQPFAVNIRNSAGAAASGKQTYKFQTAYVGAVIVGHYLTEKFRLELELSHVNFSDGKVKFSSGFAGNPFAGTRQSGSGSMKTYGMMFNVLHDFDLPGSLIRPFVGLGAGVFDLKANNFGPSASPFKITDHTVGYTGCLLAGFTYPVHDRIDVTVRYTGVFRSKLKVSDFAAGQQIRATSPGGFGQGLSAGVRIWLN